MLDLINTKILTKIPETVFLEKNNTTDIDSSVLYFDQNFRRSV